MRMAQVDVERLAELVTDADRPRVPPVDQLLFDDLKGTGDLR